MPTPAPPKSKLPRRIRIGDERKFWDKNIRAQVVETLDKFWKDNRDKTPLQVFNIENDKKDKRQLFKLKLWKKVKDHFARHSIDLFKIDWTQFTKHIGEVMNHVYEDEQAIRAEFNRRSQEAANLQPSSDCEPSSLPSSESLFEGEPSPHPLHVTSKHGKQWGGALKK